MGLIQKIKICLLWSGINVAGLILGLMGGVVVFANARGNHNCSLQSEMTFECQIWLSIGLSAAGAAWGLILGTLQWLFLRHPDVLRIRGIGWIVASSLGWSLVALVGFRFLAFDVGGFAVMGGIIGVAQWFILRRYVKKASWWVVANIVSLALPFALPLYGVGYLMLYILLAMSVLVTGLTLVGLMRLQVDSAELANIADT